MQGLSGPKGVQLENWLLAIMSLTTQQYIPLAQKFGHRKAGASLLLSTHHHANHATTHFHRDQPACCLPSLPLFDDGTEVGKLWIISLLIVASKQFYNQYDY